MSAISIGDLASSFLMRSRATQLKHQIDSLTQELATGQTSKVTQRLGGDYSYLTDIDQNLSRLEGFAVATTEAGLFLDAAQARVERMATIGKELATDLLSTVPTHLDAVREAVTEESGCSALERLQAGYLWRPPAFQAQAQELERIAAFPAGDFIGDVFHFGSGGLEDLGRPTRGPERFEGAGGQVGMASLGIISRRAVEEEEKGEPRETFEGLLGRWRARDLFDQWLSGAPVGMDGGRGHFSGRFSLLSRWLSSCRVRNPQFRASSWT